MSVIEAKPGRARHEGDASHSVRRHKRCALFGRAINITRDHFAMPVHELWRVRLVEHVNDDPLAFFEAQERTGELMV